MTSSKKLSNVPPMNDDQMADFWEEHEPEEFEGWGEGNLDFKRFPKKLIQLRLDPKDVRIIDRESKRSGIDRAQLIRSWVKEKINEMEKR
jgi:Ribbon-helix-helix protein, copG family